MTLDKDSVFLSVSIVMFLIQPIQLSQVKFLLGPQIIQNITYTYSNINKKEQDNHIKRDVKSI